LRPPKIYDFPLSVLTSRFSLGLFDEYLARAWFMPWHRSTGYFVRAVWWRIFGQIGLLTLASLSLACLRSTGRQTDGSVLKASSTRLQEICRDIVPQAAL